MQKSEIEWLGENGYTWNPTRGCTEISPGCENCYARVFAERFRGVEGHPYEQGFDLRLAPGKLVEPLQAQKPGMVFVNSMSDIFHRSVPNQYIRDIATVMMEANWHTYQVLTKRAGRMSRFMQTDPDMQASRKAEHIWWGVSVENKKHGVPRIQKLREAGTAMPWISFEPLKEDLGDDLDLTGMKWGVVGGESAWANRRPVTLEEAWVLRIREKCAALKIPFFFKQWGGNPKNKSRRDLQGRTYDEWPAHERVPVKPRSERLDTVRRLTEEFRSRWGNDLIDPLTLVQGDVPKQPTA